MVREEDLRATFDALHGREAPARAFEAADVIRQGERVRHNRRTFAVVGSGFATVAAVAAALFLLPTGDAQPPPGTVEPARPSSTRSEPRPTPGPSVSIEPSPDADPATTQTSTTAPTSTSTSATGTTTAPEISATTTR